MAAATTASPSALREWIHSNRNHILFAALILLIVLLPLFENSALGEILFGAMTMVVIVAAVAANGRSRFLFWVTFALAGPALTLIAVSWVTGIEALLVASWGVAAVLHSATILQLMRDVFGPGRITRDRLFACANIYMLIGVLWAYLYALMLHFKPESFSGLQSTTSLHVANLIYFSMNLVTSVALTDVLPVTKGAKTLVILQELVSVLYMAFIISRLVGLYAPQPTAGSDEK